MNRREWIQLLCLVLAAFAGLTIGLLLDETTGDRSRSLQEGQNGEAVAAFSQMGQASSGFSIEPVSTGEAPSTPAPDAAAFSIRALGSVPEQAKGSILIYHTHTYEAYQQGQQAYQETEQWRTADPEHNMIRVGEELAQLLRGLGFEVTHDTTAFEPPDLSNAYLRSLAMLEGRTAAGESYDLYIDLHRDAYVEGQAGDNAVSVGGTKAAKLMLLIGKGEGYLNAADGQKPNWEANLSCARQITDALNAQAPGLCKEVRLKSGRFNQHVADRCILVEVGNNRNTLAQALAAMPYLADAISHLLCP